MVGATPYVALCHAMSVMATSGISPVGGLTGSGAGFLGEILVFAFLFLALSRKTFAADDMRKDAPPLYRDPEMKIGLVLLVILPILLFLRHWGGALEVERIWDIPAALSSLWGGVFMVLSFLTTSGFESASWDEARLWSGLQAPVCCCWGLRSLAVGWPPRQGG